MYTSSDIALRWPATSRRALRWAPGARGRRRDRGLRPLVEAVEMGVEERDAPAMHPQALPNSVPEHESAVEDRDPGLLPRHVLPVDV